VTQLKDYALTSDCETFVDGATTFRNFGDQAKEHRDGFIAAANAKTRRSREDAAGTAIGRSLRFPSSRLLD
jgi:hypothetical protein